MHPNYMCRRHQDGKCCQMVSLDRGKSRHVHLPNASKHANLSKGQSMARPLLSVSCHINTVRATMMHACCTCVTLLCTPLLGLVRVQLHLRWLLLSSTAECH
jgi:hypothetical protein